MPISKITLFISSRFEEFFELKNALKETFNHSNNFHIVDLNDGKADPRSPIERSLKSIQKADGIILLIGDTYGTIVPDYNGLSYVHLEYLEAKKNKKPIYVFIKNNNYNIENNPLYDELIADLYKNHTLNTKPFNPNQIQESVNLIFSSIDQKDFLHKSFQKINTNNPSKISKELFGIERNVELEVVYNFFQKDSKIRSKLLYIEGEPGVGKTTFLSQLFRKLKDKFVGYIYYTPDNISSLEALEVIFLDMKELLRYTLIQECDFHLDDFVKINENLPIQEKLQRLFSFYSETSIKHELRPLVLFLDNIDHFPSQKDLVAKILSPLQRINFVFAGRNNDCIDYVVKQKINNTFFEVYAQIDSQYTMRLSPFNLENTIEYIQKTLNKTIFSNEKIIKLLVEKSKGLPLYLKFAIENINNKLDSLEVENIEGVVLKYLESLPDELTEYYSLIFNELSENELELLKTLFWFGDYMSIDDLKKLNPSINDIHGLLKQKISSFVYVQNDQVGISHLSIKEALFVQYLHKDNKLTALKFTKEALFNLFKNDNKILEIISYNNFSNLYILAGDNVLYEKLEVIVKYFLRELIQTSQAIDIMYEYFKITYLSKNFDFQNIDLLKFTTVFSNLKTSEKLNFMMNKFLSYFHIHSIELNEYRPSELLKLLNLCIYTKQDYFAALIAKKLIELHITKDMNAFFQTFNYEYFQNIDLLNIRDNISKKIFLLNQQKLLPKNLKLYNDGSLTYITSEKGCIEKNIIENVIQAVKSRKKVRQLHEYIERASQYLENSNSEKLLLEFKKAIIRNADIRAKKSSPKIEFKNIKQLLELSKVSTIVDRLDTKIVFLNINKVQIHEYDFYLQKKIRKYYDLNSKYLKFGLKAIMKDEYRAYFEYYVYLLKKDDLTLFWKSCNEMCTLQELKLISHSIVRYTDDKKVLEKILSFNLDVFKSDLLSVIDDLLTITFKLKDINQFDYFFSFQIKKNFNRIERSYIQSLANTIKSNVDNKDEVVSLYLSYINDISFIKDLILHSQCTLDKTFVLSFVENFYNTNSLEQFQGFVNDFLKNNKNQELVHELLIKYENIFALKTHELLLLISNNKFKEFLLLLKKYKITEQIEFLSNNIGYLRKSSSPNIFESEIFIHHIFNLFETKITSDNLIKLLKDIFHLEEIHQFFYQNRLLLETLIELFAHETTRECVQIHFYFEIIKLSFKNDSEFMNIFQNPNFMNNSSDESKRIIQMFVFHIKEKNNGFLFVEQIADKMVQARAKLLLSIKFEDNEYIKKSFEDFFILSKLNGAYKSIFNEFLQYTFKREINNEEVSDIVSSIYNKNYTSSYDFQKVINLINMNANIENEISKFDIEIIENKYTFLFYYLKFNFEKLEQFPDDILKTDISVQEIIKYLLIIFNVYKQAEHDDNEGLYLHCEQVYEVYKSKIKESDNSKNINDYFSVDFYAVALDDLFHHYIFDKKSLDFEMEYIMNDYNKFYLYIKNLYQESILAKNNLDQDLEDLCKAKFEDIKNSLSGNEHYWNKVVEMSKIQSKLQIKLHNYQLFEPKI